MVTIIAWTRNFLIIIVVNKRLDSWKRKATLLELLQCDQLKKLRIFNFQSHQISTIEQASNSQIFDQKKIVGNTDFCSLQ